MLFTIFEHEQSHYYGNFEIVKLPIETFNAFFQSLKTLQICILQTQIHNKINCKQYTYFFSCKVQFILKNNYNYLK